MSTTLLQSVKSAFRRQTADRASEWSAFVATVADSKTDAESVPAALEAFGKTFDDLETAVDLLRQRRTWAAAAALEAEAKKQLDQIERDVAAARQRLAAVEREAKPIIDA